MLIHITKTTTPSGVEEYVIGQGESKYSPYTTHYIIDPKEWDIIEDYDVLVNMKKSGILLDSIKLPNPPIKRKL